MGLIPILNFYRVLRDFLESLMKDTDPLLGKKSAPTNKLTISRGKQT